MKRRFILRSAISFSLMLLLMLSILPFALADSCVDCHTNLKKLKELAPALPEEPKKASHGEG